MAGETLLSLQSPLAPDAAFAQRENVPRALIIGCGYLGREVARHLWETGWEVTAWTSAPESAAREGGVGFRVSPVDITDLEWVRQAGQREGTLDWVINCVSSGGGDVESYRRIYLEGTRNIIAGLVFGRLLYTGSTSVYGQTDGSLVTEDSPAEPSTATGRILLETENAVLARNGIVARLAGIYGPERSALLRRFRSGEATLDGDGSRWLNTIHRDDGASGILHLLRCSPESGLCNLCDDGGVTQRGAYEFLSTRLRLPLPSSAPPDPTRKRGWSNKRVSNEKLRALGWSPRFPTLPDGLEAIICPPLPSGNSD